MTSKKCPICLLTKPVEEFPRYFSKERNKYRVGNYCTICGRSESKIRVQKYYLEKKQERLDYAKKYRKANPEKMKAQSSKFTKKYREELQDCYVAEFAAKSLKCPTSEIRQNPDLLQAYKTNMKLKRKIRNYGTQQTNRPE